MASNHNTKQEEEIDLLALLGVLWKKAWIIVLSTIIVGSLNLSVRDCLPKPEGYVEEEPRRRENRPNRERRGGFGGRNGNRDNGNRDNDNGGEDRKGRRREF